MIPSSAPPFFQIHKSHGIGYGMNSVGTAAIKKLGVICGFVVAGAKRDLSGSGSSGSCLRPTAQIFLASKANESVHEHMPHLERRCRLIASRGRTDTAHQKFCFHR
jgi:hypothetical protein